MSKKVLVIDDDEAITELLQIVLGDEGYEVIINNSGERVSDHFTENLPDVILLDFQLPNKNGDTIARSLKMQERTKMIPIIMLSSHPNIKEIAREVRVDNYLSKPFEIDNLLNIVGKYT